MFEKILENLKVMRDKIDEHIKRTEDLETEFAGIIYPRVPRDHNGVLVTDAGLKMMAENMAKADKTEPLGIVVARLIKDKPAKTAEILALLEAHGRKVGGKRAMVTLYSALKKSSRIRRLPNKQWGSLL